jgi:hypothetical protein
MRANPPANPPSNSKQPADAEPQVAQDDVLGEDTLLQMRSPMKSAHSPGTSDGESNLQSPQPAEDENQPGFIGERNRSDAPGSLQGNKGGFSDSAPGLVAPSGLNEGDTGVASDKPEAGGQLDFDDGDMVDGGRGKSVRTGGNTVEDGAEAMRRSPSQADPQA